MNYVYLFPARRAVSIAISRELLQIGYFLFGLGKSKIDLLDRKQKQHFICCFDVYIGDFVADDINGAVQSLLVCFSIDMRFTHNFFFFYFGKLNDRLFYPIVFSKP